MLTFLQDLFNKLTEKQLVFFWLIFCFFALTYKLGGVPPYHSDENYYVESTRNMVESGDYLTPIYRDKKRFAKPILYYWLMSASYKIFGVSLVSARLTSAFFGSLTIGLLYLFVSRLFEGKTALYSALILPATYLHFQISRWATTDIVMSFFVLLALYYFIRLYQSDFKKKMDACLFYLAMGLGFMTKGPPAIIIPGVVVLIFLFATRGWRGLSKMHIGPGLLILSLLIVPWFAMMFLLHGDEFQNHIIGAEIKNRLVHDTSFSFYYFEILFRYYLPWILFFLMAVLHQSGIYGYSTVSGLSEYFRWKNLKTRLLSARKNEPVLFCYIWILACLVLFTLVRTEHSRYMLPASSAVAILTAKFFVDVEKEGLGWLGFKVSAVLTSVIFFVITIFSGVALHALDLIYPVPAHFFFLPVVFLVAGVSVFRLNKKRQCVKQVFVISFSLVLAFSFLSGEVLPHVNRYPMKLFSEKILSEKLSDPIAVYRLGNQRARLGVLTGQKSFNLSQPGQIRQFMDANEKVLIVMREKDFRGNFSDAFLKGDLCISRKIEMLRQAQPDNTGPFCHSEEQGDEESRVMQSSPLKVVAEDTIWLKGRIDGERLKELWGKAESAGVSGLTEKIYLLSNR